MDGNPSEPSALRFGAFRLGLETAELYKNGTLIKLQPQPFKVLALLAGHAGQLVTREEIQQQIWGSETFVDFEKGLNFCIKQIRDALGDDADAPRYIETLPRRGYRFIAPLEVCDHATGVARVSSVAAPGADAGVLPRPQRRLWLIGGAAAVLAGVAALVLWHPWRPRLAFQQRDWVLISSFENRTGEPVFDGTLEYALERELGSSAFVNVVPRERVADILALMKKPPNTRVDAVLGREICLRDGGIRALLTGRVDKLDSSYLLSFSLVDPKSGALAASATEEAGNQHEILAAVHRLSRQVRNKLSEALATIQKSNVPPERVTTPSLRALQLYTQGMALFDERKGKEAAELLERAVTEDPEFASAHILLARSYMQLGKSGSAAPHFKRAFDLADKTTDRERYFILANYYQGFLTDWPKAAEAYEVLLRLYPDDYWSTVSLRDLYWWMGQSDKARPYAHRAATLRPNDFQANTMALITVAAQADPNAPSAEFYLRRIEDLALQEGGRQGTLHLVSTQEMRAYQSWFHGEVEQAQEQMGRAVQTGSSLGGAERDAFLHEIGYWYLLLGKLEAAEESFQHIRSPRLRNQSLVQVALAKADEKALQKSLDDWARTPGAVVEPPDCILLIRSRRFHDASTWILLYEKHRYREATIKTVRGELALARGRTEEAILLLRDSVEGVRDTAGRAYFLGAESLANALEHQGRLPEAVQTLERAEQLKPLVVTFPIVGPLWLRNQCHLALLYRKVGREQDARKIEDELRKLLAYADPDYPMLLDLNRLQNSVATHSPN